MPFNIGSSEALLGVGCWLYMAETRLDPRLGRRGEPKRDDLSVGTTWSGAPAEGALIAAGVGERASRSLPEKLPATASESDRA